MTTNSSFSKINPNLQVAWDSTSLGLFKECPYKYYLTIVEGYVKKVQSHHLTFGILYHSCLELYDRERAKGQSHDEATLEAVRHAMMFSGTWENEEVDPLAAGYSARIDELTSQGFIDRGTNQENGCLIFSKFTPWQTDIPQKSRPIFVRAIVWYLEHFKDDPAQTVILANGQPAVELSFKFEPGWNLSTGEPVILCGHLDRVADLGEAVYILDRKTTKSTIGSNFFDKFSPDNQMSLYAVGGKIVMAKPVAGVIIDGVQLAVGFSRFQRGFANRTPKQLEEWLNDAKTWIKFADACANLGEWPMNDKSCHNYGGCVFREVCSKDPQVRRVFLDSNFEKKVWDPLKSREV